MTNDPKNGGRSRRILAPVDFGGLTEKALEQVMLMAKQTGGSVKTLHVVEPMNQPFEELVMSPELDNLNKARRTQAEERLDNIRERFISCGIPCEAEVVFGKPWQKIVEKAAEFGADLLILPTHGRTGMQHLLLGSTAERVARHAPCSVLVVR